MNPVIGKVRWPKVGHS